jgi:hypothetical protein
MVYDYNLLQEMTKEKQTAITRTLLTLEMLTKNSTATCTQNQEHFTILLEQ